MIFPRSFNRVYPVAVRGEGAYIYDDTGKRYLDACGGSAVVSIGHGVREIADAIAAQAARLAYAHSSQFNTQAAEELASLLAERFPGKDKRARVHFTSGGSEATETAIKVVRQYWLSRGQRSRYKVLSRWQSYHGATLGALGVSGNRKRREPYAPLLPPEGHISACFCYRCPLEREFPSCDLACGRQLQTLVETTGLENVAAFIVEPIVGASSGAVPPEGYLRLIREICDRYEILLIADEVMTGAGRTGRYFAVEHWDVVPDIVLLGKGLTSGYMPLGAVLVGEKIWRTIEVGTATLEHGFTYQAHPPSAAAGLAVQRYIEKHDLVSRAESQGAYLAARLGQLKELRGVGDVRGKGLLQTVEFVADKSSRRPFPPEFRFSDRLFEALRDRGVLVYPMRGTADGTAGDHILIAPPFVIEEAEIDLLVNQLASAIADLTEGS
ncbi:MAG: aspartate aminotransferase family protein [Acidobacteria bacterium]|nr:aspartate aminotransferase family protein [Acidobacteriota bacterium]